MSRDVGNFYFLWVMGDGEKHGEHGRECQEQKIKIWEVEGNNKRQ
jgi:hypothetical protein